MMIQRTNSTLSWTAVEYLTRVNDANALRTRGRYSLDVKDRHNNTILHIAVLCRSFSVLTMLVREFMTRVDTRNILGLTPIHLACINNDYDVLRILIQNKSASELDVYDNEGRTPLMITYVNKNRGLSKMLYNKGCMSGVGDIRDINGIPLAYVRSLNRRNSIHEERARLRRRRVDSSPIAFFRTGSTTTRYNTGIENRAGYNVPETPTPTPVPVPVKVDTPIFHINEHIEMLIELKKTCPVCLSEFQKENTILLKCFHALCIDCHTHIKNGDKKECPMRCGPL